MFEIGDDASDDNLDRGIKFKYNDGAAKIGFFGMDDTDGSFVALSSATDSSSVFTGTAMEQYSVELDSGYASLSGSSILIRGAAVSNSWTVDGW